MRDQRSWMRCMQRACGRYRGLLLVLLVAVAAPPPPASASDTWYSSLVQDGEAPGQYSFISVLNMSNLGCKVAVEFRNSSGTVVVQTSKDLLRFEQWNIFTANGGGVATGERFTGYATVTTTGDAADLHVWSAVVLPSTVTTCDITGQCSSVRIIPGFSGTWSKHP